MDAKTRETAREAGRWGGALANLFVSSIVGVLPERWRGGIEARLGVEVHHAALLSGVLQLFLGLGVWMLGLGWWMQDLMEGTTATAEAQASSGKRDDMLFGGYAMLWLNPLMPFVYTFLSPVGFLSFLAAMGGGVRLISLAAYRENVADPTLALIDAGLLKLQRKHAVRGREKEKGDAGADRHFSGDGKVSDLRILSREDYPWREGGSIVVVGKPFRLVSRADTRDENGRLRVLYDMKLLDGAEILRGPRVYSPLLPPRIEPGSWPPARKPR